MPDPAAISKSMEPATKPQPPMKKARVLKAVGCPPLPGKAKAKSAPPKGSDEQPPKTETEGQVKALRYGFWSASKLEQLISWGSAKGALTAKPWHAVKALRYGFWSASKLEQLISWGSAKGALTAKPWHASMFLNVSRCFAQDSTKPLDSAPTDPASMDLEASRLEIGPSP